MENVGQLLRLVVKYSNVHNKTSQWPWTRFSLGFTRRLRKSKQDMTQIGKLWTIALVLSPDNRAAESLLHTALDHWTNSTERIGFRRRDFLRGLTSTMVSVVLSDPKRFDAMLHESPNSARRLSSEDRAFSLLHYLRQLPRLERVIMAMRELEGWDAGEIATLTGLTRDAVLSKQADARLTIGKWLMSKDPSKS
ncbi:sigma-70-like protein [Paraburkholderia sp. BL8N3]|nr:sigma-70-like protein [Paraburkholderia sp. BL8N3]